MTIADDALMPSLRAAARDLSRDRYLCALLAPREAQDDLVTLAAFHGELARIPLMATDANVGEIRLQWWRDAIGATGTDVRTGNPVTDALLELAQRRALPAELLLAAVEGRSRELYEDGIRDETELADYAWEAEGATLALACGVLGVSAPEAVLADAGTALALTRLALSLPLHLSHGRLPFPPESLGPSSDPRGCGEKEAGEAVRTLTAGLAEGATAALARFQAAQGAVEKPGKSAFLPLALVVPYLAAVQRPKRDALREVADISPLSRVLRLWFAHQRGRI
jgi:phytoene synthase